MTSLTFEDQLQVIGYQYVRFLGAGSFANVHLVYSEKYQEYFALKQSKLYSKSDLSNEITSISKLDHPNIIRIYSRFSIESLDCLVMEFCENGSLEDRVLKEGVIHGAVLYSYLQQLVFAINYMHSQNIAHHDIKPANILINSKGKLKLTDFGISQSGQLEEGSMLGGSRFYLDPDVFVNGFKYDSFKGDIYALGVTLYFLVEGVVPWTSSNPPDLRKEMAGGFFHYHRSTDPDIHQLINQMIEPNPNKRISLADIIANPLLQEKKGPAQSSQENRLTRRLSHYSRDNLSDPFIVNDPLLQHVAFHQTSSSRIRPRAGSVNSLEFHDTSHSEPSSLTAHSGNSLHLSFSNLSEF